MNVKATVAAILGPSSDRCHHTSSTGSGIEVDVAMLGARQHYAVPRLLDQAQILGRFYSDIYADNRAWGVRLLSVSPHKLRPKVVERFLARSDEHLSTDRVVSFGWFGLWYLWQTRRAVEKHKLNSIYARGAQIFNQRVIRYAAPRPDVLYGYNGASLELFQHVKEQGGCCMLDQTSLPSNVMYSLFKEELERWPGWQPGLNHLQGEDVLGKRERAEWQIADVVIGASPLVLKSIQQQNVPEFKCRLAPYGVSLDRFSPNGRRASSSSAKLRVLAVACELLKGTPYFLEALRLAKSSCIEARLVGQVGLNRAKLQPYQSVVTFLGPVPRAQMAELYRWADLLVVPSICEGSALVTYEALATGLPVVATPNTGAPIRDGIDGLIVPIRDVEALAAILERFASNREFLRFCSHNALEGRDRLGLDAYRNRLVQLVYEMAGKPFTGSQG